MLDFTPPRERGTTRRDFMRLSLMAGAGLTLGGCAKEDADAITSPVRGAPTAAGPLATPFVRIDPDNTVILICKHLEAGQGVWTGLAAVLAEELDAAWPQMRVEGAPARTPDYGNLAMDKDGGMQSTGGSTSMANSWMQLREAGATARALLVAAAAARWKVQAAEVAVRDGVVTHPGGQKASFGELAADAGKLPLPHAVTLKDPASFRLIGQARLPRLDSRAKTTGMQRYAIDVVLPGMLTAMVARAPRFGATVASFDAAPARAVDGVVDVVQIASGVAVLARDTWSARRGRDALQVIWDETGAEKRGSAQLLAEFRQLAHGGEAVKVLAQGDVAQARKAAATVVEAEFELPYLAHAPMEPLTAVCRLAQDGCEIWAGCQFQTVDQKNAARVAGLKPAQVTIHTLAAGGTFGRRATAGSDYIVEVVEIAKAIGGRHPVRLIWTREDDIGGGYYRPMNLHRISAGLDAQGQLSFYEQRVVGQSILAGTQFASFMKDGVDPTAAEGSAPEQYGIAHAHLSWSAPKVGVPVLWWRSVGHSHMAFSKEVMLDELAHAAGRDPVAFRLGLLGERPRHAAVLKLAAAKAGWETPWTGGAGRGRGVALHESFGTVVAQVAQVRVDGATVHVERVVCAVDCGIAVTPDIVRAQMESGIGFGLSAALHGRITLREGRVEQGNFHQYPVLRIGEMPRVIEVHIVPSADPPSGVGEPGTPPIAPAVANAVRMATGRSIRSLPIELAAAPAKAAGRA